MLCRKIKSILVTNTSYSSGFRPVVQRRSFSKWFDQISGTNMTFSSRFKRFRDVVLTRILNAWTRNSVASSGIRRFRRERRMREMLSYFRHVFRSRTHYLVYASVAYKKTEEKAGPPKQCSRNIKDKALQQEQLDAEWEKFNQAKETFSQQWDNSGKKYINDLESIEEIAKATLYCEGCDKRVKLSGSGAGTAHYCECKGDRKSTRGAYDGWTLFMEAPNMIVWRKEYKPGGKCFAYKVYGRYKDIFAKDFALINVDSEYRSQWDDAVERIETIEKDVNGIRNQDVLHWVVLWPRLFSNRDYVYIRRHKEFSVQSRCLPHKADIFPGVGPCQAAPDPATHAPALSAEDEKRTIDNKVYVIVSRSCTHPGAPEPGRNVRVLEYWSHMVVTSLRGPDQPGTEFVLTYYDEPVVGGMPASINSWVMSRSGPAFIEKMHIAAEKYRIWRQQNKQKVPPDFESGPSSVAYEHYSEGFCEETLQSEREIESSEAAGGTASRRSQGTQTPPVTITAAAPGDGDAAPFHDASPHPLLRKAEVEGSEEDVSLQDDTEKETFVRSNEISEELQTALRKEEISIREVSLHAPPPAPSAEEASESESEKERESEEEQQNSSWWRYLYPFYYFL